jgi:hypothetical protein
MSDALERLKTRNRPVVPSRDASITPVTILDIETSRNLEVEISESVEILNPTSQESVAPLETKQTTLRLEIGVSDRLQDLGRNNGVCREVLVEAMLEYCEANLEALQAVLGEAKKKNEHRQAIANQKRAKSMMQRFGQG